MTVTSAAWTTSALSQAESSYANYNKDTAQSTDSFAHYLKEDMRKDKTENAKETSHHTARDSASETRARRSETQSNDTAASAQTPQASTVAKPPVTGSLAVAKDQTELAAQTDATRKEALANPPSEGPDSSLLDNVLAGMKTSTSSGSILLAMLMQSQAGMNAPTAAVAAKTADTQDQQTANQQTSVPNLDASSLNPASVVPVPNPLQLASSDASVQGEIKALDGAKAGGEVHPMDDDSAEPKPAAAVAPHLAFALRLNATLNALDSQASDAPAASPSVSSAANPTAPQASTPAVALTSVNAAAGAENSGKKEHGEGGSHDQTNTPVMMDLNASANAPLADPSAAPSEAPVASQAPIYEDKLQDYSTETVHNVQMQVVGEDNRRVDVRLIDRAGELRVSVKSGDSSLNNALQSSMPDLTSRLQSAQYNTEVWMPASGQQSSPSADSADEAKSQFQRPAWVDDLEGVTQQQTERVN